MTARGFSVIELLVTMTIVLLIAGALAASTPPARRAFERIPMELDVQQRGRTAIDAIAQQVRSALAVDGDADALIVATPIVQSGQGTLAAAQTTLSSSLPLAASACPNLKDVCGFVAGSRAIVIDSIGHDLFAIASVSVGARSVTPDHALSHVYGTGTSVMAVDQYTFSLERQADGSDTLVRTTAAGAVQPIVDFVSDLVFGFDTGRISVSIRVHPSSGTLVPPRDFRASISLRNAS